MVRSIVGAFCLSITLCVGQASTSSEFLVVEAPIKKRAAVSLQAVGAAMATTLQNAARCVERLGALQQKLIIVLGDMVDNGRKSGVGQKTNAERARMRAQVRELSMRIDAFNKAIDHYMRESESLENKSD